jgi:hypothetical protein
MLSEFKHLFRDFHILNFFEVICCVADLVEVSQRCAEQSLFKRLKSDHALAFCDDDAAERDHVFATHRFADHRECVLPDLIRRHYVVRRVEVTLVDLSVRHELVDLNRVRALDLNRFELGVIGRSSATPVTSTSAAGPRCCAPRWRQLSSARPAPPAACRV